MAAILCLILSAVPFGLPGYRFPGRQGKREFNARQGYISLFRISENMGAELSLDAVLGEVKICRENRSLLFYPGRREVIYKGDLIHRLKKPPVVEKGEVLVPLDALRLVFRELALPGESWVVHRQGLKDSNRKDEHGTIRAIPSSSKINVVFIDAGHGGRDPGAVGYRGLREATVVLDIARRVAVRLRRRLPGIRVILTRKMNRTMSLTDRARIANRYIKKGYRGIFVSIHANATRFQARSGYETYYLSPRASNAESRATAAMENGALEVDAGRVPSGEMGGILSKMLVEEYRRESLALAHYIQARLKRRIGAFSRDRGVKRANFFVMRCVFMPSVLVEVGFITNPREGRLLGTPSHRNRIAIGIVEGVGNFVSAFNRK